MANTTYFGWETPDDTDLVKDGAAAIRTLGQAIDTSLQDLEGGTTGQVLKKNSNTDMDFIWAADSAGMTNPLTTTGDTIYSSSGTTPARLGIGTAGQVLTVNSGATAPEWATPAGGGGGKVLQVLNLSLDSPATTSSATPSSTGLSLSITPSSATSKILIFGSINGLLTTSGSCRFYLYKGASSIKNITSAGTVLNTASITFLDSPATTSATTYAIYFSTSAGTAYINDYVVASGDTTSQITVMEIGA